VRSVCVIYRVSLFEYAGIIACGRCLSQVKVAFFACLRVVVVVVPVVADAVVAIVVDVVGVVDDEEDEDEDDEDEDEDEDEAAEGRATDVC
jgi:hypothetical protein